MKKVVLGLLTLGVSSVFANDSINCINVLSRSCGYGTTELAVSSVGGNSCEIIETPGLPGKIVFYDHSRIVAVGLGSCYRDTTDADGNVEEPKAVNGRLLFPTSNGHIWVVESGHSTHLLRDSKGNIVKNLNDIKKLTSTTQTQIKKVEGPAFAVTTK